MTSTADPAKEQPAYHVQEFIDPAELRRDLSFSLHNISDAMIQQASLFAHYGVLAAKAQRQTHVVELLLENTEAAVYKIIRDEMASKGEKVTEALLDKLVTRHSKVIAMKKALNEAKRIESLSKTAVEAFRHRRDMLVQQGLIQREELKGEMAISQRSAREDAVEGQKNAYLDRKRAQNSAAA